MALTIKSSFEKLRESLEITELQKSTTSIRQQNVRQALEEEMTVLDSMLTGSYCRSTMIAPLKEADVDIMIILDSTYYKEDGQASLLDKTKRVLLKTYTKTPKISRNGQAVTITFTDFIVDVVPAFYRKGGGYIIADCVNKKWISTNPTVHIDIMSRHNSVHFGKLVPIVKMIKRWNKSINHAFISFYLELLAINVFRHVTITDYPSGMRYFFYKGKELIKYTITDPAGLGSQVNGLDSVTVTEAVSRFETAYNRAILAEEYANTGKTEHAINEWRKIFGNYFPAYG